MVYYRVGANTNLTVIHWMDNGMVQALSTFLGSELGDKIDRWSRKNQRVVHVQYPKIIYQYNKYMA